MTGTQPDQWRHWYAQGFRRLPLFLRMPGETLPESWEGFATGSVSALLESGQGGRYTFLCDRPERVIVGGLDGARIWGKNAEESWRPGEPLALLDALLSDQRTPPFPADWPAMAGGFIGAFGYDLVRSWERLPVHAARDPALPVYAMVEPAELFIYDHSDSSLRIVVWTKIEPGSVDKSFAQASRLADLALSRWRNRGEDIPSWEQPPDILTDIPPDSFTRAGFLDAVQRVKGSLEAGHTYQTNLSLRQSRPAPVSAAALYESLRRVNPSPYMGLLRLPEFSLVCGSPELLVRMTNGRILSRPIAGTRRRGTDADSDRSNSAELLANEKERAEHLMLVDLIRNDIGRTAEPGSVRVREFMGIERYSHVMHIVSEVEGQLIAGKRWPDVVRSMFPGGTITGCPKIRTMEIIEELEPVGRGFYTGSLGWISYQGEMELNIIIRSMLVRDAIAHVQAGAGIVADSVAEREYDEVLAKAEAMRAAFTHAMQVQSAVDR